MVGCAPRHRSATCNGFTWARSCSPLPSHQAREPAGRLVVRPPRVPVVNVRHEEIKEPLGGLCMRQKHGGRIDRQPRQTSRYVIPDNLASRHRSPPPVLPDTYDNVLIIRSSIAYRGTHLLDGWAPRRRFWSNKGVIFWRDEHPGLAALPLTV